VRDPDLFRPPFELARTCRRAGVRFPDEAAVGVPTLDCCWEELGVLELEREEEGVAYFEATKARFEGRVL